MNPRKINLRRKRVGLAGAAVAERDDEKGDVEAKERDADDKLYL